MPSKQRTMASSGVFIIVTVMLLALTTPLAASGGPSAPSQSPAPALTSSKPPLAPTRSAELGFTPWPYDNTLAAVKFVYAEIAASGDFIAHHIDSGIPWDEALTGQPYPDAVEEELRARVASTPSTMRLYVALSPVSDSRDGLAGYWSDSTNQPLPEPWASRAFSDAEVISAYTSMARDLIQRFGPQYFNIGVEVSELLATNPGAFDAFEVFLASVASTLHDEFPDVQLMISVALKTPGSAEANTIAAELPRLVEHIDVLGISVYPYVFFDHADKGDPATLPADWLRQATQLAHGKPVAIAETGWIAEDLVIPEFSVNVPSDSDKQAAYVRALLDEVDAIDGRFIVWFSLVDFDALWAGALGENPIGKIWRDTGLIDGDLDPRPALSIWRDYLARPL